MSVSPSVSIRRPARRYPLRPVLLAAVLALGSTATLAQSNVTVYGLLDAGLETLSNQSAGHHTFMAGAGGSVPDLWGMKGTEDLGGGLKATFNLEGSMNLSTGTATGATVNSNGGFFGRESNVGLSGAWGAVKLGLQLDPAFISALKTDPRGAAQSFSVLPLWIGSNLGAGASSANTLANVFDSAAISYSYNGGGFSGTLLYSMGGVAGSGNTIVSGGVSYQAGPLLLSGGAYRDTTPTGASGPSEWNVGAAYLVNEALALKANYVDIKGNGASNAHFSIAGIGGSYSMGATTFNAAYYLNNDKANGGSAKFLTLGVDYALSKRTGLYAQIASAQQSASGYTGAGLVDLNGGAFSAGQTVSGLVMGVHHAF